MLEMTRLNGEKIWINPDQIKMIFSSPDTTLIFADGSSLMVRDSVLEIEARWLNFRRNLVINSAQDKMQESHQ